MVKYTDQDGTWMVPIADAVDQISRDIGLQPHLVRQRLHAHEPIRTSGGTYVLAPDVEALLVELRRELTKYFGAVDADDRARNLAQALQSDRYPRDAWESCYELIDEGLPRSLRDHAARECWHIWLVWDQPSNWVRFSRLIAEAGMRPPAAAAWLRDHGYAGEYVDAVREQETR